MYIEYSRRHYNRRWEIIKRENFMEYYDPWDWNVPSEDMEQAYWVFRQGVSQDLVYKKHISNMLTLHKYRNAFRSWVPFYHSWIDPFDRRWATKSNKWPSYVNIRSLRVDQGLRPGHTNISYIREFLLFEVKPFFYKKMVLNNNRIPTQWGLKVMTQRLLKNHTMHNNRLIYKNFHKKRLKKKYEYIKKITQFDYKQMQTYYDRWFSHDWYNLMGWTSLRLILRDQKVLGFAKYTQTYNKISNLLEELLLIFKVKSQRLLINRSRQGNHKEGLLFQKYFKKLFFNFNKTLKEVLLITNRNIRRTSRTSKKYQQFTYKSLLINNNIKFNWKQTQHLNLRNLKSMLNLTLNKTNFLNLLNNTFNLINVLEKLEFFFLFLKNIIKRTQKREKTLIAREKKREKFGLLPHYERKRRRIKHKAPSVKFSFHKLDYKRRVKIIYNIKSLLQLMKIFKKLLYMLRGLNVRQRKVFLRLIKKHYNKVNLLKYKKKKIKKLGFNKSAFFLREKRFSIGTTTWQDPLFRLKGDFDLDANANINFLSTKNRSPLTLNLFNKLIQLYNVKSLKQFLVKSKKKLTYYRHLESKIPTKTKNWETLSTELTSYGSTYYPYYLRIYSWLNLPAEAQKYKKNKNPFLLVSGPLTSLNKSLILSMRFKRKNLYFTITDFIGRVLVSVSAASQGISKGRYFSAHLLRPMYQKLVRCFRKYKISSYFFKARSKHKGLFKYLRVYLRHRNIFLRGLIDQIKRPHNGMRRRKTRRL